MLCQPDNRVKIFLHIIFQGLQILYESPDLLVCMEGHERAWGEAPSPKQKPPGNKGMISPVGGCSFIRVARCPMNSIC